MTPKVIVLAQTPPPFHGQSVMQQYLVNVNWDWCNKEHIRLNYSDSIDEIGSLKWSKITRLFGIISRLKRSAIAKKADLLYYPPAGPKRIPLYRDVITMWFAKKASRKILLHFHAGGLNTLIDRLSPIERYIVKRVFRNIDHAIVLLPSLRAEVSWFSPKYIHIVPNGIEDMFKQNSLSAVQIKKSATRFLFVGNLTEEKGIFVMLEAAAILMERGYDFHLSVMGAAHSATILQSIESYIYEKGLGNRVLLLGTRSGSDKWKCFDDATVFCLPTYAMEAMPVSILEAMMFAKPVISTKWRAIPDLITDGLEGMLVPVKDPGALAAKMQFAIDHPELVSEMGQNGRKKYTEQFTVNIHLDTMESLFKKCLS